MNTNTVPSILQYGKRVALWGCESEGDYLRVTLAFFSRGLTAEIIKLKDRQGNLIMKVLTPPMYLNSKSRGRAQNIYLKIVRD